ncbi:MAG: bifunctional transaldolase/phosoglucose isomerase [Anaerolineales bacterium]|jgi:transaldolase/glucose-6-phosphate isomerase
MTKIQNLLELGQAIWIDYIRRSFINSGELQELINQGIRGITSNPSIFEKAIAGSSDYDNQLQKLVEAGKSVEEIYEKLVVDDIQRAADLLRPIYDETNGDDGYVSLEVNPNLAHDTQGTIEEARLLFKLVNRPNVMIKVPATPNGIPAIEKLTSEGMNINITLIFSREQYEDVAEAYIKGLEGLLKRGGDLSKVASVASFFISRVDNVVDQELDKIIKAAETDPHLKKNDANSLKGKIGIANAKLAYKMSLIIFSGERWEKLSQQGARYQRPLWASTSTKNPTYADTLYVDNLIGPNTVNTLPPTTLQAFIDHGSVSPSLETGIEVAGKQLDDLAELGVDLDAITDKLLDDGVYAFAKSFAALMEAIDEKQNELSSGWEMLSAEIGEYRTQIDNILIEMKAQNIMGRIWAQDHTIWNPDPAEISNRLGWLNSADVMIDNIERIYELSDDLHNEGYTNVLLLGMGGSSLAPEVFSKIFDKAVERDSLKLEVLDSTHPDSVMAHLKNKALGRTLFIVATKSGSTVETLSFLKFFYNQIYDLLGADRAGDHFIAITDPGSKLVDLAERYNFRDIFLNDPNIGGRYSALSYFGLVPAGLVGVDLYTLLERSLEMKCNCESCNSPVEGNNYGAQLGVMIGEMARSNRNKLTFITSPEISPFGDWVEQLIAESTGKEGKSILPIVREPIGSATVYGDDRVFVYLRVQGDDSYDEQVSSLKKAGHPVIIINWKNRYDIGAQFFLWEMATAIAGYRLKLNPFDQPNVESAKLLARQMVKDYTQDGVLPDIESHPLTWSSIEECLEKAKKGAYIAIQAYIKPGNEVDKILQNLRANLRIKTRLATSLGYGPRYLHSTGQLHKGDNGEGIFIQFTSEEIEDIPIPEEAGNEDSSITFGTLMMTQALGDAKALENEGREVIRFHLGKNPLEELHRLNALITNEVDND